MLLYKDMPLFHKNNEQLVDSSIPPIPAVEALREWYGQAIESIAMGKEVNQPPEIPRFDRRRDIRAYREGLNASDRLLQGIYESGVVARGLVEALYTVREQQTELAPAPKKKYPPYTPRHQR